MKISFFLPNSRIINEMRNLGYKIHIKTKTILCPRGHLFENNSIVFNRTCEGIACIKCTNALTRIVLYAKLHRYEIVNLNDIIHKWNKNIIEFKIPSGQILKVDKKFLLKYGKTERDFHYQKPTISLIKTKLNPKFELVEFIPQNGKKEPQLRIKCKECNAISTRYYKKNKMNFICIECKKRSKVNEKTL